MRLKLAVVIVYALGLFLPLALMAGSLASSVGDKEAPAQIAGGVIMLNVKGTRTRGAVRFDHNAHDALINPDPNNPHPAKEGAACVGCHHTVDARGIVQLWKCTSCHKSEGQGEGKFVNTKNPDCDQSGNPKNGDCDELYFERAFHDKCIECHIASNKEFKLKTPAPITCGGCHRSTTQGASSGAQ